MIIRPVTLIRSPLNSDVLHLFKMAFRLKKSEVHSCCLKNASFSAWKGLIKMFWCGSSLALRRGFVFMVQRAYFRLQRRPQTWFIYFVVPAKSLKCSVETFCLWQGPKVKQFMDIFSIPEMTLLAVANDYFITNDIEYDPVHLFKDVSVSEPPIPSITITYFSHCGAGLYFSFVTVFIQLDARESADLSRARLYSCGPNKKTICLFWIKLCADH